MEFNKIADLIIANYLCHDKYEDTLTTINYHSALICKPKDFVVEPLNFESFDEQYLIDLQKYWKDKEEALSVKYRKIIYEVDSDDYK